jgi:hypothetical protein
MMVGRLATSARSQNLHKGKESWSEATTNHIAKRLKNLINEKKLVID